MIDSVLASRDEAAYDYSSDGNMLPVDGGRPTFIQSFYEMFNAGYYIALPWFIKYWLVVFVWYVYYNEHFGFCHLCVFTLFGFVE